jgi:hypothetical protein
MEEAFFIHASKDPPITAKRPRSARDWEDHQETITRLYSQGNKLAGVIEVMEKEYGFSATFVVPPFPVASLRYVLFWFPRKEKISDVVLGNANTRENYLSGA